MTIQNIDLQQRRLDLADTRGFARPGAGPARRRALAAFGHDWLRGIWEEATAGRLDDGIALAAVGSLARADGGPLSDYDLVLLHTGRANAQTINTIADALWYPIWDAKVKLDHSVRTVAQCRTVAQGDLSATIGLLDLAHVAGDPEVVAAARATVAHDWRGGARKRLPQLVESLGARHVRQGDVAHNVEPDLKEARGGLRDLTILAALTQAWLADRAREGVDEAATTLLDVRDALHVVTGRGRDRLGREDQDAVAALLGHASADDLLTEVANAGRTIAYAVDSTVRRAGQSQRARTLRVGPRRPTMTPLGYGLYESDGEVVLGAASAVDTDALLPMRAALVASRAQLPIAPVTLTNLASRAPDLRAPWPRQALDVFGDLLATGPGLVSVWEGLDQAGIVERWIPEWRDVRSRPQRSPVHRHTVDRHLIETVVHASALVRRVARADLLLVAALLHDVGKVAGAHDHSVHGAPIARRVAQRMGYGADDVAVIERLVREHLTLIDLATRRDHQDPRTLDAVRTAVADDHDTFDLLAVLTEADAAAAGPAAWTDWRATLMGQFVTTMQDRLGAAVAPSTADGSGPAVPAHVLEAVLGGSPSVRVRPYSGAWSVDVTDRDRLGLFADTAGLLAAQGFVVRSAVLRTVDGVAVDEWHVESPGGTAPAADEIRQSLERLATGDRRPLAALERHRAYAPGPRAISGHPGQARAFVVPDASPDATVVEVRAHDRLGLLHDLGVTFAKLGLSVRSAHVATYAGQALDTFYITEFGGRLLDPPAVAQVVGAIIDTCEGRL